MANADGNYFVPPTDPPTGPDVPVDQNPFPPLVQPAPDPIPQDIGFSAPQIVPQPGGFLAPVPLPPIPGFSAPSKDPFLNKAGGKEETKKALGPALEWLIGKHLGTDYLPPDTSEMSDIGKALTEARRIARLEASLGEPVGMDMSMNDHDFPGGYGPLQQSEFTDQPTILPAMLEERRAGYPNDTINVPRDEEQIAAEEGRVTPAQQDFNQKLQDEIAKREGRIGPGGTPPDLVDAAGNTYNSKELLPNLEDRYQEIWGQGTPIKPLKDLSNSSLEAFLRHLNSGNVQSDPEEYKAFRIYVEGLLKQRGQNGSTP